MQNYSITGMTPLNGVSYSRIRTIGKMGKVSHSPVVKLRVGSGTGDMGVYPNPLKGNTASLQINAMAQGAYLLAIYNAVSQSVLHKVTEHTGGSAVELKAVPLHLVKGVY